MVKQQQTQIKEDKGDTTRHGFPAFLSFFVPGLGQLIKGHMSKAMIFFAIWILAWISIFILIGFLAVPITHILAACDAYNSNSDKVQISG